MFVVKLQVDMVVLFEVYLTLPFLQGSLYDFCKRLCALCAAKWHVNALPSLVHCSRLTAGGSHEIKGYTVVNLKPLAMQCTEYIWSVTWICVCYMRML